MENKLPFTEGSTCNYGRTDIVFRILANKNLENHNDELIGNVTILHERKTREKHHRLHGKCT